MGTKNSQSVISGDDSINVVIGGDANLIFQTNASAELVDQKIAEAVSYLKKARFFSEFKQTEASLRLASRLESGDLSAGSDSARSTALAWCVRLLSRSEDMTRPSELLKLAQSLGNSPEIAIAEAFVASQIGSKSDALKLLAANASATTRSAALMIVSHHDGPEGALSWKCGVDYSAADLDSDGKHFLLSLLLNSLDLTAAAETACNLLDEDFEDTPSLHHLAALANVLPAVPAIFRASLLIHPPFDVLNFPLASDWQAMAARCKAHKHFIEAREAAAKLGLFVASKASDEYALWLELNDPQTATHGKARLQEKLRDSKTALSVVHYALQLGIQLDTEAVERDIERNIALNGGMTGDAAIARFALAFAQPTPEAVADYIARHHAQLSGHIDAELMRFRQVEMLARAGRVDAAVSILDSLRNDGISAEQEANLERIVSEAKGVDPVEARKTQYTKTRNLPDLLNLVDELEGQQNWHDLCRYGRLLFDETRSLKDAERLASAFYNTANSAQLVAFLEDNSGLLEQSIHLRLSYAWGLFHEGTLLRARDVLEAILAEENHPDCRALRVNLAIAMGDRISLNAHIEAEFKNRKTLSARELMAAAQLALHIGSPHAKELVFEAAGKANENPEILAAAYLTATKAGWEGAREVFQWLERAAELSTVDGPLRRATLEDISEWKPEWDRHESDVWSALSRGEAPIFLAAKSLNRTLVDLTLFPALANMSEADPRRRGIIPAYSGKRPIIDRKAFGKSVVLDPTALLTLCFVELHDVVFDSFDEILLPHVT